MHITLVQPPALMAVDNYSTITQPPLGIAYLAAYARELGYSVTIVDAVEQAVTLIRPWPLFGLSYIYHPGRLWRLISNVYNNRQETKVDRVIREYIIKMRISITSAFAGQRSRVKDG